MDYRQVVIHPQAHIAPRCTQQFSCTLVGMGSIIMDGAVIGKNCIVGAGALVTGGTQIPDGMLVLGSPAKARRPLTDEEIAQNHVDAEGYVAIGKDLVENGIAFDGAHLPDDIATIAVK